MQKAAPRTSDEEREKGFSGSFQGLFIAPSTLFHTPPLLPLVHWSRSLLIFKWTKYITLVQYISTDPDRSCSQVLNVLIVGIKGRTSEWGGFGSFIVHWLPLHPISQIQSCIDVGDVAESTESLGEQSHESSLSHHPTHPITHEEGPFLSPLPC